MPVAEEREGADAVPAVACGAVLGVLAAVAVTEATA
jgi:hypothetical protein